MKTSKVKGLTADPGEGAGLQKPTFQVEPGHELQQDGGWEVDGELAGEDEGKRRGEREGPCLPPRGTALLISVRISNLDIFSS